MCSSAGNLVPNGVKRTEIPAHLVFIDERAVTTTMLRLNGWNPRGERLVSAAPFFRVRCLGLAHEPHPDYG
jgi:hypothetical protein